MNTINDAAHFLLLNSENVEINGFKGTIPLLYFFFAYGHHKEKQQYFDFAFDLLHKELSKPPKTTLDGKAKIELGWVLMRFVSNGFFESDEFEEILNPFDKMAVRETQRLSRDVFHIENLNGLLLCALYFFERTKVLVKNDNEHFEIKEHLLISLFELTYNAKLWDKKKMGFLFLMKLLLKESKEHSLTSLFGEKLLTELNNNFLYGQISNDGLSSFLSKYLECPVYGEYDKEEDLKELLSLKIEKNIIKLYVGKQENVSRTLQEIIVFSCVLARPLKEHDQVFLMYALNNLYKDHDN